MASAGASLTGSLRPRRELVLLRIQRPGAAGAVRRDLKSELRIGDHVDPGRRRPLIFVEDYDVFAAVRGKPAEPVEELERRRGARGRVPRRLARCGACAAAAPDPVPAAARADRSRCRAARRIRRARPSAADRGPARAAGPPAARTPRRAACRPRRGGFARSGSRHPAPAAVPTRRTADARSE